MDQDEHDLELEDESVRIAVRALGAMRSGQGAPKQPPPLPSQSQGGFTGYSTTRDSYPVANGNGHAHGHGLGLALAPGPETGTGTGSPTPTTTASHTPALSLSLASTTSASSSSYPPSESPRTPVEPDDTADDHDRDRVGRAARRNGTSTSRRDGESAGRGAATESTQGQGQAHRYPSLARMQSLPLVSGALRVYEAANSNSRVVQYTSSLVTSSLRHALPAGSGERIDEFAGGMLDRLERYRISPVPPAAPSQMGKKTLDGSRSPTTTTVNTIATPDPSSSTAEKYRNISQREPDGERERDLIREYRSGSGAGSASEYGDREDSLRYREDRSPVYRARDEAERGRDRDGRSMEEAERDDESSLGAGGSGRSKGKRRWDGGKVPGWLEATSPFVKPPPPPPPTASSSSSRSRREESSSSGANGTGDTGSDSHPSTGREVAVTQRSRSSGWQAVLLEAGGLSAALSDESMRRLRYCLQWLQYATQHIDAQILILRDFIASLHPHSAPSSPHASSSTSSHPSSSTDPSSSTPSNSNGTDPPPPPVLTPDHLRTLTHLRSDIVHTIRQVVGVVSKYAGGALPEPARGRVRGFILDLPKRFGASGGAGELNAGASLSTSASATGIGIGGSVTGTGTAARRGMRRERGAGAGADSLSHSSHPASPTHSAPGSPHTSLRPLNPQPPAGAVAARRGSAAGLGFGYDRSLSSDGRGEGSSGGGAEAAGPVEAGRAMAAAQRVLTLATESLDMMRGVTAVVSESLDRADAWVDRLRTVGIQRGMDGIALPEADGHAQWAGATPAWAESSRSGAASPRYTASTGGAPSPILTYGGPTSPAPTGYGSSGPTSPTTYAGAPSPGIGFGAMSLGSRYSTPAPGAEDESRQRVNVEQDGNREAEAEGEMEVDG